MNDPSSPSSSPGDDPTSPNSSQPRGYDLIFMDIQMPNLDGLQSTRLIRKMGYSAPIVALTAFAEESNVKECMDSGMDFFLPKPIRRPALKQVLKRYCSTIPEVDDEEGPDGKGRGRAASRKSSWAENLANGDKEESPRMIVDGIREDDEDEIKP
jgi:YesN/AraC family two-component response regulator